MGNLTCFAASSQALAEALLRATEAVWVHGHQINADPITFFLHSTHRNSWFYILRSLDQAPGSCFRFKESWSDLTVKGSNGTWAWSPASSHCSISPALYSFHWGPCQGRGSHDVGLHWVLSRLLKELCAPALQYPLLLFRWILHSLKKILLNLLDDID